MNTILVRIRELITQSQLSDTAFAQKVEIGQTTLSAMFQRDSDPRSEVLQKIVKAFNVNPKWLLLGEGDMFLKEECVPLTEKIPLLRQKVSCGPGQTWSNDDAVEEYIEPLGFLQSKTHGKVYAFRVRGTSMVGAGINDGDIVFFDSSVNDCMDDMYVFALEGNVYCKLLKFDAISQKIQIFSVHTKNLAEAELLRTLDANAPETLETFHLFGRVLAWLHENNVIVK